MGLKLTQAKFLEHFANRAPCLIGMEVGAAPHHTGGLHLTSASVPTYLAE